MTYKCMSRMYAYGCLPRSYYQHNVPNSGFSLFFLSFSFFFISALIMSRSWSTWIQHHKKHQPHSFWVEVNTNTNLTNTAIENTERLLSPRLSCGTPPGSGMFCVPSSYPGQVFSCCKMSSSGAAVPILHPLHGTGSEPGHAAGQLQPTGHQLQPQGLCQPHSTHKTLLSRGKGNHEQSQQEKGEPAPHSFPCCASLARPWGVWAHITSPVGWSSLWAP